MPKNSPIAKHGPASLQSRRSFFKASGALAAGGLILPGFSIGRAGASANSRVNVAAIGVGGRGGANWGGCREENIVALCDLDDRSAANAFRQNPKARRFKDFRVMLEKMGKEIDGVLVSTPDHTHFVAALSSMQLGKHIYVEKPLVHNIWEARTLKKAAQRYKVISQMGNQGHATDGIRSIKEWYEAGVLGNVREVHAWLNGPHFNGRYFVRPKQYPPAAQPIPKGFDWDLWLGPAKERAYSEAYAPRTWRGWWEFGGGLLGDWACHTIDAPFWALNLGMPTSVTINDRAPSKAGLIAEKSKVHYEFPERDGRPSVAMTWYEGGLKPALRPEWGLKELPSTGMIMVGDRLSLMTGGRPNDPKLLPNADWKAFQESPVPKSIPRVQNGPQGEWLAAIKGDGPAPGSNFDYAAELTEVVLLGVLAQRYNQSFEWDASTMRITDKPHLNAHVREPARKGWEMGDELWQA
jgi:predicted dehydrogenase